MVRRSCISKLFVNITHAPVFNLSNFAKPPLLCLFIFYPEQPELLPMGICNYLEFCQRSLLCKAKQGKSFRTVSFLFIAGSFYFSMKTSLSKSTNSLSFYLTTSFSSADLNKYHNCKPNKCFIMLHQMRLCLHCLNKIYELVHHYANYILRSLSLNFPLL